MHPQEKAAFFAEIAKLIQADFHLDRALQLLVDQDPPAERARLLTTLQHHLASGHGLAAAATATTASLPHSFSALDLALLRAGEHSGRLGPSLSHLAAYYDTLAMALRRGRSALVYPLILAHLGILLPQLPAAITSGDWTGAAAAAFLQISLLWGLLFGLLWGWTQLARSAATSAALDRLLSAVPLLGPTRRHWALARFTRIAHSALLAALPPHEWLRLAADASDSGQLRDSAHRAADRVALGNPIAPALRDTGGFSALFVNALDTAEQSGTLDHELTRWALLEAEEAAAASARAAEWLPRLLYGIVMLYVAWRIIDQIHAIYAPVLDQLNAL